MGNPNILLFGATGQVAKETIAAAGRLEIPLKAVSRSEVDFSLVDNITTTVLRSDADVVVNAVAFTAVDKAETEPALAQAINADAVGNLAAACARKGVPLIHVSTDYVFDGLKSLPYEEEDPVNPISVYGATKLRGELALKAAWSKHVILRTSWVYSSHGTNFLKTMLRLGRERDELNVVCDQYGSPTSARGIAETIVHISQALHDSPSVDKFGVFHYAGSGYTSWFDFSRAIFQESGAAFNIRAQVKPISAVDFKSAARRPVNSRLNCDKIRRTYGIQPAPWQLGMREVLSELQEKGL